MDSERIIVVGADKLSGYEIKWISYSSEINPYDFFFTVHKEKNSEVYKCIYSSQINHLERD